MIKVKTDKKNNWAVLRIDSRKKRILDEIHDCDNTKEDMNGVYELRITRSTLINLIDDLAHAFWDLAPKG